MIHIETSFGTIDFEPTGRIKEALEAQSPEDREKLEQHISRLLTGNVRDIARFSFGCQESIEDILDPVTAAHDLAHSFDMVDSIFNRQK